MSTVASILHNALLILIVIASFNLIIFVHELGHFLAGKWRGLKIERFQIWFGKPIWKKEINGVQYGLGWIPAGGFVALPQMAPMEAVEGRSSEGGAPLPPISPLDKIIVAVAGPLFSMLLAFAAGAVVWKVGKPHDFVPTRTIGYVLPDGPAEKAGLRIGDQIAAINGKPVQGFAGNLDCITESIVLSRGDEIRFTVERAGESKALELVSKFEIKPTKWFQRRATRKVGIAPAGERVLVAQVATHSPAEKAGLKKGDVLISANGTKIISSQQLEVLEKSATETPVALVYEREGKQSEVSFKSVLPKQAAEMHPMFGMVYMDDVTVDESFVYPTPWTQVADSARMMWITVTGLIARDSSIGIDQLSGPVGIFKVKWQLLQTEYPIQRILWFFVLFNVNLAIFNMLPLPILDGGHITLAVLEWIAKRPVRAGILEVIQTAFAFLLIGLFLYITSKDIGDSFGRTQKKPVAVEFAP